MGLDPVGGFGDNEALIREAPQIKARYHRILLDRRIFYLKENRPDGGWSDAFGGVCLKLQLDLNKGGKAPVTRKGQMSA